MFPFWKLWVDENHIKIEDKKTNTVLEMHEKTIFGTFDHINIQAFNKGFSIEGFNLTFDKFLNAMNPFTYLPKNDSLKIEKDEKKNS